MKRLNEYEKGFIEAAIDGEGCICIYKYIGNTRAKRGWQPRIRLSIANNNKPWLDKIKGILCDEGSFVKKGPREFELRFSHNTMRWLFPQITLIIKEEKKSKALSILSIIRNGRNRFDKNSKKEEAHLLHLFEGI